jgi:transcriptional regulator GlxA family with amidase domain
MTATQGPAPQTVGILLFPDVEILDFFGPFHVFSRAALPPLTEGEPERWLFTVIGIAETADLITSRAGPSLGGHGRGLMVQPHYTLDDHPPLDIVVVPGGPGTWPVHENLVVLDWIAAQHQAGALTTSVCTGAFLLGAVGLLDGKRATTHWLFTEQLRQQRPGTQVLSDARVVDEDQIVTSAGVSAGIDMALHVVARLHGEQIANRTARFMDYDWTAASGKQPDR